MDWNEKAKGGTRARGSNFVLHACVFATDSVCTWFD
jgi:hypothetical protein